MEQTKTSDYVEILLKKREWHMKRYLENLDKYKKFCEKLENERCSSINLQKDPNTSGNKNNKSPHEKMILEKEFAKYLVDKNLKEIKRIDQEENLNSALITNVSKEERELIQEHIKGKTFQQMATEKGGVKETYRIRYQKSLSNIAKVLEELW